MEEAKFKILKNMENFLKNKKLETSKILQESREFWGKKFLFYKKTGRCEGFQRTKETR